MATPALEQLARHFPETEIRILAREEVADLYISHPRVSGIIRFNRAEGMWSVARRIKAADFDAALLLPNSHRTALEVFLARVPMRAGLAAPFRSLLLTHTIRPRPERVRMRKRSPGEVRRLIQNPATAQPRPNTRAHHVHDYLHLVSKLFGADPTLIPPSVYVGDEEICRVVEKLGLSPGKPFFAMSPGAQYGPAKCWPAQNFIETAKAVRKESGGTWLILGGNKDAQACDRIAQALNVANPGAAISLAGKTNLRELMALLKSSRLLLTNDSGSMHLAAALGTPLVAVFGSTSPELTGPVSTDQQRVKVLQGAAPCSPCYLRECPVDLRCLRGISAEAAAQAALEALQRP
jgi:heptosyltransferase-2